MKKVHTQKEVHKITIHCPLIMVISNLLLSNPQYVWEFPGRSKSSVTAQFSTPRREQAVRKAAKKGLMSPGNNQITLITLLNYTLGGKKNSNPFAYIPFRIRQTMFSRAKDKYRLIPESRHLQYNHTKFNFSFY